jgi:hypothetical protein
MNYFALNAINKKQAEKPGKWLAIVGDNHRATSSDPGGKNPIPGIAELTGSFSAYAFDAAPGQSTTVELFGKPSKTWGRGELISHPDFLIKNRYVTYPDSTRPLEHNPYRSP